MNRPRLRRFRWRAHCIATAIRATIPVIGPLADVWRRAFTAKRPPPIIHFHVGVDIADIEATIQNVDRKLARSVPLS